MVKEAFAEIEAAVKAVNPQIACLAADYPDQTGLKYVNSTPDLASSVQALKVEWKGTQYVQKEPNSTDIAVSKPRQPIRMAFNQILYRDAGRKLPHIWLNRTPSVDADPNMGDYLKAVYAMGLTNGYITNYHTIEYTSTLETVPPPKYPEAISYAVSLLPYVKSPKYLTWAAVHYSERNHDDRNIKLAFDSGINEYTGQEWGKHYWPVFGAIQTLMQNHVPYGIINDTNLVNRAFENIKVILVPHPEYLGTDETAALNAFVAAGGIRIDMDPNASWHNATQQQGLFSGLWNTIVSQAGSPPIQVNAPANTQAGFMKTSDGKLVVSLLNDTNWIDMRQDGTNFSSQPGNFDASIVLHTGNVTSAKKQPENTSLSIQTQGADKMVNVTNIGMHTVVVLDGVY